MASRTVFQDADGNKLTITENGHDCYRDYCARLGQYGEHQTKLYGNKETLIALLQHRYGITPGKYVRQLGDTILCLPTKVGLSGSFASAEWTTEYWYCGPDDGLKSFAISAPVADLQRFSRSFDLWDSHRGFTERPLLLYQYGRLYCPDLQVPRGRFYLKDITQIPCWQSPPFEMTF